MSVFTSETGYWHNGEVMIAPEKMTYAIRSELVHLTRYFVFVPEFAEVFIWKWCEKHSTDWMWLKLEIEGQWLFLAKPEEEALLFRVFSFLKHPCRPEGFWDQMQASTGTQGGS